MSEFKVTFSKFEKKDPFPYESNVGSRHAFPGTLNQERLILKPREGFVQDLSFY